MHKVYFDFFIYRIELINNINIVLKLNICQIKYFSSYSHIKMGQHYANEMLDILRRCIIILLWYM
jgi:hypothetical protein